MTLRLILFLLCLSFPAALPAQNSAIRFSQRVGDTIDRAERDYFVLFQNVPAFHSASTVAYRDSTLLVRITTRTDEVDNDTLIAIPRATAQELARYIDNFEAVYRYEVPIDFPLLHKVASPNRHPSEEGSTIEVVLRDGRSVSGELLFVGDSTLVIGPPDSSYDWRTLGERAWRIRYSSIEVIRKHRYIWEGWAIGAGAGTYIVMNQSPDRISAGQALSVAAASLATAAIGNLFGFDYKIHGNLTAFREIAPIFDEKARFNRSVPTELKVFANDPSSIRREVRYDPSMQVPVHRSARYHIWGGLGSGGGIAPYTFAELWVSNERTIKGEGAGILGSIGVEYSLSSLLRLGISYAFPRNVELPQDQEIVYSRSINVYGNFVVIPRSTGMFGPFELCMGPGIGVNMATAENRPRHPYDPSDDQILIDQDNVIGLYLRAALDLYILDNVSVCSAVDIHFMPNYEFDERVKMGTSGPIIRDRPHEVDASGASLLIGAQLHL